MVARGASGWFLMTQTESAATVTLADVLDALEAAPIEAFAEPVSVDSSALPASSAVVRLHPLVVGRVTRGGVVSEDLAGDAVVVGPEAIGVADLLDQPATIEHLAHLANRSIGETTAAVMSLVQGGWAHVGPVVDVDGGLAGALRDNEATILGGSEFAPSEVADPNPTGKATAGRLRLLADDVRARVETAWRLSSKVQRVRSVLREAEPLPTQRIPVYAVWHPGVGMPLALGMITASARAHRGGVLLDRYDIHRPEAAEEVLRSLGSGSGPAVLLCSDYLWTIEENLQMARQAKRLRPELLVVHGGPSCPKYGHDAEAFLRRHGDAADLLVRGEGEHTVSCLLDAVASLPNVDQSSVREIPGLSFLDRGGRFVRTSDPERIADLGTLPSPYLTGEFDDVPFDEWGNVIPLETNRGCPYKCTFCDWGASIASRVRFFDLDRVLAEIAWIARTGRTVYITDANFGMAPRDREIAAELARTRRRIGEPRAVYFTTAKRSTTHLVEILDTLTDAGIATDTALSLQSTDPATLAAVDRRNISTQHYLELARAFRVRGQPPVAELMLGLPGQTLGSYREDLQFCIDHGLQARTWETRVLPNSPMNDSEYRKRWSIHTVATASGDLVVSNSTFTEAERYEMLRSRLVVGVTDRLGLARHVWRFVQWDHGVPAVDAMTALMERVDAEPTAYPHLAWTLRHFSRFPAPVSGWAPLMAELRRFVEIDLGVAPSSALDTVMAVQEFLMPRPSRRFPASIDLSHDYAAYFRDATATWYVSTEPAAPQRPLAEYGPARFAVDADPLGLCSTGIWFDPDRLCSGNDIDSDDFHVGTRTDNELVSAVAMPSLALLGAGVRIVREDLPHVDVTVPERPDEFEMDAGNIGTVVRMLPRKPIE